MSETPLDQALAAAKSDPSRQTEFYGLLLETELFFPVVDVEPGVSGDEVVEPGQAISPFLLEVEGAPVLPVFDTSERLAEWAKGTEMRFGGMPGYAIVEMVANHDPTVQLAFNIGLGSFLHLGVDDVDWLFQAWQKMAEAIDTDADEDLQLALPSEDYSELKTALRARMQDIPEIERAYVVLIEGLSAEQPHEICVVLEVADQGNGNRIAEELVPTAAAHEPEGESVVIAGNQPRILQYARNETEPFYERLAA